ncbi:MAG TPA: hypothetical protein PLY95_04030 [Candidatus Paceibacterota bacterium]|nr:hypothetical protein [Candidatus Paceibacterota bacterium]
MKKKVFVFLIVFLIFGFCSFPVFAQQKDTQEKDSLKKHIQIEVSGGQFWFIEDKDTWYEYGKEKWIFPEIGLRLKIWRGISLGVNVGMLGGKETNYISGSEWTNYVSGWGWGSFQIDWSQDWTYQYPTRPTIGADLKVVPFHIWKLAPYVKVNLKNWFCKKIEKEFFQTAIITDLETGQKYLYERTEKKTDLIEKAWLLNADGTKGAVWFDETTDFGDPIFYQRNFQIPLWEAGLQIDLSKHLSLSGCYSWGVMYQTEEAPGVSGKRHTKVGMWKAGLLYRF